MICEVSTDGDHDFTIFLLMLRLGISLRNDDRLIHFELTTYQNNRREIPYPFQVASGWTGPAAISAGPVLPVYLRFDDFSRVT